MLIPSIKKCLNELVMLLNQLSESDYVRPCVSLSNASIGEHTRHIIDLFQCLQRQYECGIVNYDKRERNFLIQTNVQFAIENIVAIQHNLDKDDKKLQLQQILDGEELLIQSNYFRELLYNLEHCIHHQALIKVAAIGFENINVHEDFGVARSTIEYRKQCAQ